MGESIEVLRWAPEAKMTWQECGTAAAGSRARLEAAVAKLADQPGIYRARPSESKKEPWHFFYVDESGRAQDSGAASHIF